MPGGSPLDGLLPHHSPSREGRLLGGPRGGLGGISRLETATRQETVSQVPEWMVAAGQTQPVQQLQPQWVKVTAGAWLLRWMLRDSWHVASQCFLSDQLSQG